MIDSIQKILNKFDLEYQDHGHWIAHPWVIKEFIKQMLERQGLYFEDAVGEMLKARNKEIYEKILKIKPAYYAKDRVYAIPILKIKALLLPKEKNIKI